MKFKKNLLIGTLAALSLGVAHATTGSVTYFSGATSFQATTDAALLQYATNNGGNLVTWDNATFGKETNAIYTYVTGGVTNQIIVHWAGSENIIQALAAPSNNPVKFNYYGTNAPAGLVSVTNATNSQSPQAALYDNAQGTSFFNGNSAGDGRTYGSIQNDTPVAVEGYVWIANTNWPVAATTNATVTAGVSTNVITYGNITSAQVRELFSAGAVPLAYITGNAGDTTNAVFAFGRNIDGGTRTVWFNETGLGVQTPVVQYQLVVTNGLNKLNLYPIETIDGISSGTLGNSGYSSDGTLRGLFTNALASGPGIDLSGSFVGYAGNNYFIGYSSTHNATGSAGVKFLTYNGVVPSSANVENGTYSGWAFARVGESATASTTASHGVATSVESIIQSFTDAQLGAGNAKISNLQVNRDSDGGNIYPIY
jgi:hypothetical protein